jgi:tetratricopeptide (TPR) repeat protein
MCFAALGARDQAVEEYGRSIALYDGHPGPFHLRGKLLVDRERFADAIADFDRFLGLAEHPEVLQLRGYAKLSLGRGRDAVPDLLRARELAPDVYTDYLLAWAGAIAPDDELFYWGLQSVLAQDPSYRQYFLDNDDYRRFYDQPRFHQIVGPGA